MNWRTGQILAPWEREPITKEELTQYAESSGDRNPIHLDEAVAKRMGLPTVIVHGMITMAYLGDFVHKNFPAGSSVLRRLQTRFRRLTFPGDTLTLGGTIKKIDEDGTIFVTLWAKNQIGEVTTDGEAEVFIQNG